MPAEHPSREPRPSAASEGAKPSSGRSLPRHLLEEVLRQTSAMMEDASESTDEDLGALLVVARRHVGRVLTLEPVLIELVEAMLRHQFEAHLPTEDWEPMARQIAETLYEDPAAQERLQRLWSRLLAVVT